MKRMNQGTLIASIGVLLMLVGVLVLSGGSKSLFGTAVGGNGQSDTQLTSGSSADQATQPTSVTTAQLIPSTQFPGVILLLVGLIVAATGMVMRRKPMPSMR